MRTSMSIHVVETEFSLHFPRAEQDDVGAFANWLAPTHSG